MVSNACRQLCAESYRLSAKFEMFTSVRLAQCSARGGAIIQELRYSQNLVSVC